MASSAVLLLHDGSFNFVIWFGRDFCAQYFFSTFDGELKGDRHCTVVKHFKENICKVRVLKSVWRVTHVITDYAALLITFPVVSRLNVMSNMCTITHLNTDT